MTVAIGLTSLASGVIQVVFLVFFLVVANADPTGGLELNDGVGPDLSVVAVFVVANARRFRGTSGSGSVNDVSWSDRTRSD